MLSSDLFIYFQMILIIIPLDSNYLQCIIININFKNIKIKAKDFIIMAHQSSSSQWDRYDKKQKQYQCPCGKAYYSYPALYTHIKSVHNGNAPGQIKRPDVSLRGRPRLTGLSRLEQHTKSIQPYLKTDPIPKLINFINQMESSSTMNVKQLYSDQPVFKLIKKFQQQPINPKFVKEDEIFQIKMGEGLIVFFNEIQGLIQKPNNYHQVVLLITLLTEYIIDQTQDQTVLSQGTIGLMPEFVNYFIIHDLQNHIKRLKIQDLWICQKDNTLEVLDLFFKWMLFKKYTLTKVTINKKYGVSAENSGYQDNNDEDDINGQYQMVDGKRLRLQDYKYDPRNGSRVREDESEQNDQGQQNYEEDEQNVVNNISNNISQSNPKSKNEKIQQSVQQIQSSQKK